MFKMDKYNYSEIDKKSKEIWESFAKMQKNTNLMFPDENLIRIFSQRYVKIPNPPAKILDHGFGSGNNLVFFATKGYECYGCEIAEELINIANEKFEKIKIPANLKLIKGDRLAYDDNFFDIVISWNVIHYLGEKQRVIRVIGDFHRILKKGGVLILSTLHPNISLLNRAKPIGNGSFEVIEESPFDNRKGLTLFATKGKEELMELFSIYSEIKYGYYNFDLFLPKRTMSAQLIYAIK